MKFNLKYEKNPVVKEMINSFANSSSIESILYGNYIKYDKMSELVESNFKGSTSTSVNIFIDIYSMFRNVHMSDSLNSNNQLILSSSIINLCAHIRHFFRSRYKVESNIYIVHSDNIPEYNKKIWFGYNDNHQMVLNRDIELNNIIKRNIEVLKVIVPYLPNIYFLSTEFEAGVLMYDIMCINESNGNTNPNIIFSTDPYLFQIVNMVKDTYIFRPKKYRSEDVSYVVSKDNLLEVIFKLRSVDIPPFLGELDSGLCSLLITLSRCPERSIKSFFNLPTASKIIYSGVSGHKILNGYNSNTKNIWDSIYNKQFDKYTYDLFDRRFKVIDLLSQYLVFLNMNFGKIKLIDLVDPNTIKDINNNYFKDFPLDLDRL